MRSLTRTTVALLVISITGVLAFLLGLSLGRSAFSRRESADSAPVVEAVKKIAKLATVQMEVADVVRYEEVRQIIVFEVPKNATMRLRGTVLGGFDLLRSFSVIAEPRSRTLRIDLPAPQVLSVDARVEWFDERSGWLNPITPADRTRWSAWARGALGRAAKDAGLYERANENARELLTTTAAAFGWKAVINVGARPKL